MEFVFSLEHIMTSITLTLTGNSSLLNTYFHPEIELDSRYNYSCCLLDFHTYNSIPNNNEKNNKFYYVNHEKKLVEVTIPVGSYEIEGIIDYLIRKLADKKINIKMIANEDKA